MCILDILFYTESSLVVKAYFFESDTGAPVTTKSGSFPIYDVISRDQSFFFVFNSHRRLLLLLC